MSIKEGQAYSWLIESRHHQTGQLIWILCWSNCSAITLNHFVVWLVSLIYGYWRKGTLCLFDKSYWRFVRIQNLHIANMHWKQTFVVRIVLGKEPWCKWFEQFIYKWKWSQRSDNIRRVNCISSGMSQKWNWGSSKW